MVKEKGVLLILAIFLLFFLPSSTASLILSNPDPAYSLGDSLNLQFKAYETQSGNGLVKLNLKCENETVPFYVVPSNIEAAKEKTFEVPPLTLTKSMLGACKIYATLEDESKNVIDSANTEYFQVNNAVNISLELNKKYLNPADTLKIKGISIKANGKNFVGQVTLTFDKSIFTSIADGTFDFEINLLPNVKSGKHEFKVEANDSSGNYGQADDTIFITAVPTKLKLMLNAEEFLPNEKIIISAKLLDQGDDIVDENISVVLYNSIFQEQSTKLVTANDTIEYSLPHDASSGNWEIIAYSYGIKLKKSIFIKEVKAVNMTVINDTLEITNIGNVPYNSPIEVTFEQNNNSAKEIKEINLAVNAKIKFKLGAPDGTYTLDVKSGNLTQTFDGVQLTGAFISMVNQKSPLFYIIPLIFILVVVILAVISNIKARKERPIQIRKVEVRE